MKGTFEPFAATEYWNKMQTELIQRLQAGSKMALRSRLPSGVYYGKQVVDVLYPYLQEASRPDKEITRENAIKVCRLLVQERVLLPEISNKEDPKKPATFDENKTYSIKPDLKTPMMSASPCVHPVGKNSGGATLGSLGFTSRRSFNVNRGSAHPALLDVNSIVKPRSPFSPSYRRKRGGDGKSNDYPMDVHMSSPSPRTTRKPSNNVMEDFGSPKLVKYRFPGKPLSENNNGQDYFSSEADKDMSGLSGLTVDSPASSTHISLTTVASDFGSETNFGIDETVLYEIALLRLLALVEVNMLEGIIHVKETATGFFDQIVSRLSLPSFSSTNTTSTNHEGSTSSGFSRRFSLRKNSSKTTAQPGRGLEKNDPIILSALNCLPGMDETNLMKELSGCQRNGGSLIATQIEMLIQKVQEERRKISKDPLISQHLEDLVEAISRQHLNRSSDEESEGSAGPTDHGLEACQLLLLLIPASKREQLKNLLHFFKTVLETEERGSLGNQETPISQSVASCANLVFVCSNLSHAESESFFAFLVSHSHELFLLPYDVKEEIKYRLAQSASPSATDPVPVMTYCERISPVEFSEQKVSSSEAALLELGQGVLANTAMTLEDKEKWFQSFNSQYPQLFQRHFHNIELTTCQRISQMEYNGQKMTSQKAVLDLAGEILRNPKMDSESKEAWFRKFAKEYPELHEHNFQDLSPAKLI